MKTFIKKSALRYDSDDQRWEALCRNDAQADGFFFYAVTTTGIYCRPSCTSRQPSRKNVAFYASCAAAEQAGFRACKRCQPDGETLTETHVRKIAQACRLLEETEATPSLEVLARAVGMSKFHFHRVFVEMMGMTPKAYSQAGRAEKIRRQLAQGGSMTQAIYEAGYASSRQFYQEATRILGMRPKTYRDGGKDETICFAVGECSLGAVLVASSLQGICALSIGDEPEALVQALEQRFRQAAIIGGDHHYEQLVARVIGLLEVAGTGWNLPLDIRGTVFQKRVWQVLQTIPSGTTLSYGELAARIGSPGAVRAVASACAANPLAVAIPCHRVVRRDGSLSGYRWGVERKRRLLEMERC
ncbi:MAG: bifunctional DNA-binding transcriptional regulator/O6-methylguanine-DNA methyltransferase Ada [Thiothrix sp.]|nr:bifunctional DNA-binding transcriptional regulator/O6-methylguanine-DNA methyltransferase Ada [Thiothrix sp.]HPQ95436.1 bifunctional DNA-binding transcriptional regulator/O6-methylguanine-DNA methyltransferase Ada [Thiolinea sp.]